jgi:hypothetical protein
MKKLVDNSIVVTLIEFWYELLKQYAIEKPHTRWGFSIEPLFFPYYINAFPINVIYLISFYPPCCSIPLSAYKSFFPLACSLYR